jgi:hypothetical protein
MNESLPKAILGLLVTNVAYLLFTMILASIFDVSSIDILTGPMAGAGNSLLSAWVTIGALLGAADVLAIVAFISNIAGGAR